MSINVKNEINRVLNSMAEAFAEKDPEKYLDLYLDHPELVIYGSQSGEKWTRLSEFKESVIKNWLMVENVKVIYDWQRIDFNTSRDVAWFATELTFETEFSGQKMKIPGRLTGVLVKKNSTWKFVQTHYSMEHQ